MILKGHLKTLQTSNIIQIMSALEEPRNSLEYQEEKKDRSKSRPKLIYKLYLQKSILENSSLTFVTFHNVSTS